MTKIEELDIIQGGLKICLNGTYGKLSSMYSKLYTPETLLAVTLTGQLTMLMAIEALELGGISVLSSNTDSLVFKCKKSELKKAEDIIGGVELVSGLNFEFDFLKAQYYRDVNSYVYITENGKMGAKGVYAPPTLSKNNEYPIVFDAIKAHLKDGTPMEDVIKSCTDVTKFVSGRAVAKGGHWKGKYLGRMVRFFYSTEGEPIYYTNVHGNDAKVATTDGAKPMMDLVDKIPADLDYDKYIELAHKHLENLGC